VAIVKSRDDRTSGPKPLASSAARRVEAIIEGAEQAAGRVIDDAEAKARAYLSEAEAEANRLVEERLGALGELTDALIAQADAIHRQSELLSNSLREAKARLESDLQGGSRSPFRAEPVGEEPEPEEPGVREGEELNGNGSLGAAGEPPAPHLTAVDPPPPERPVAGFGAIRERGTPAGARLLATQMAVSGSSREEIAARLRNGFEIEDADAILDAILGPDA
jgi:vacuolar-type H+-ATPase subunit H